MTDILHIFEVSASIVAVLVAFGTFAWQLRIQRSEKKDEKDEKQREDLGLRLKVLETFAARLDGANVFDELQRVHELDVAIAELKETVKGIRTSLSELRQALRDALPSDGS